MVEVKIDDNGIAVITFDDGKANALSPDMLTKLDDAITQVESEAKAIVLVGRPERFSAGFDLKLMLAGPDAANALLTQGVKFFGRLFTHPEAHRHGLYRACNCGRRTPPALCGSSRRCCWRLQAWPQ